MEGEGRVARGCALITLPSLSLQLGYLPAVGSVIEEGISAPHTRLLLRFLGRVCRTWIAPFET